MSKERRLYLADFMTGLLAGLSLEDVPLLSLRNHRFDLAMEKLYEDLKEESKKQNFNIRFRIRTHPIHRDSTILQRALYEAAQRDLVSLDNPEFQDVRLKISREEAGTYLKNLIGSADMYRHLAKQLMKYYQEVSAVA